MVRRHVLAWISTGNGYCRELLRGVFRYTNLHRPWSVDHLEPRSDGAPMDAGGYDGVIALDPPGWLVAAGIPLIDLSNSRPGQGDGQAASDDHAAGVIAAEHLLGLGHTAFAFAGLERELYSRNRLDGFAGRLGQAGFATVRHVLFRGAAGPDGAWMDHRRVTADWLRALPRPCGLLASSDNEAFLVARIASDAGIAIPDDLAIIGVDDDELLCDLCDPPLTSVRMDPLGNGMAAAGMLHDLLDGRTAARRRLLPPQGIAARASTAADAVADPLVRAAIAWMRSHALARATPAACARALGVAPRTLQARFAAARGRGPAAELLRLRLEHAGRLLRETDEALKRVAQLCGFHSVAYFTTSFGRAYGTTPARWRAAQR